MKNSLSHHRAPIRRILDCFPPTASPTRGESFDFVLSGYREGVYTLVVKVTDTLGNTVTARAELR